MPKKIKNRVSANIQHQILELSREGFSGNEIGSKLGISPRTAHKYIKLGRIVENHKYEKCGVKKKLKRKHLLRINRFLKENSSSSLIKIIEKCNLECSPATLSRFLHDNNIKKIKKKKKPLLNENHLEKRIFFCKKYGLWKKRWSKVVFTDEKKFNLDGPDGYNYYWSDITKDEKLFYSKRPNSKKSVMVWGAFCNKKKISLIVLEGKMNSEKYMGIIENNFLHDLRSSNLDNFYFQQDNCPIHVSEDSLEKFQELKIDLLYFPPCSPDMNPIENIWGYLVREVYANGKQYSSVPELKKAIFGAWNNLPSDFLRKLIKSMPNRINECIRNGGGNTHY